jgi:hypothetical protein
MNYRANAAYNLPVWMVSILMSESLHNAGSAYYWIAECFDMNCIEAGFLARIDRSLGFA